MLTCTCSMHVCGWMQDRETISQRLIVGWECVKEVRIKVCAVVGLSSPRPQMVLEACSRLLSCVAV